MPKCFLTGIEMRYEDARVLDLGAAMRALRDTKLKAEALEHLIEKLGRPDEVEIYDRRTQQVQKIERHRLICPTAASALSSSWPELPLIIRWQDYQTRRPPVYPKPGRPTAANKTHAVPGGANADQDPAKAAVKAAKAAYDAVRAVLSSAESASDAII